MVSPNREPRLPRVEESDLLGLVFEEVIDPAHAEWWKEFAGENPLLARQVLKRAYFDSHDTDGISSLEIQRRLIDIVSFAMRALKSAAERVRSEQETTAEPHPSDTA